MMIYSTGRRKTSSARIFMTKGVGLIKINNLLLDKYFSLIKYKFNIIKVLKIKDNLFIDNFNYFITVRGGGLSSQSIAIRHGISRAILKYDNSLKKKLRLLGFITRDSRKVERKKYGFRKSRCKPQYSKR